VCGDSAIVGAGDARVAVVALKFSNEKDYREWVKRMDRVKKKTELKKTAKTAARGKGKR
jgi:hypothetical protein